MPFDPNLLKKVLITILIIAGLFTGYQLLTPTDETESENTTPEAGYSDEEIDRFSAGLETDEQYGQKIQFNNSFEHTAPGEYSEIIVNAEGFAPGEFTIVYVRFAGTEDYIEAGGQEHRADSDGKISTRFIITQYGDYEVFLSSDGETFVSPTITVQ